MFHTHTIMLTHTTTTTDTPCYSTHATHAHHAHTHHAFLYAKVYSCTYCGRKSHLTKFCYDRINASIDHWVRKINTVGPKKIWVPKSTPLLIDIGTHQSSKT